MTLGEKIKNARKQCGLSQEELSEKLNVSRSAVAKWETDKGLPDIDNLKAVAKLLSVSVDYLLDDSERTEETVMREPYDISKYGRGLRKTKKDRVMREKFPDAKIYTLLAEMKLKKPAMWRFKNENPNDFLPVFTQFFKSVYKYLKNRVSQFVRNTVFSTVCGTPERINAFPTLELC